MSASAERIDLRAIKPLRIDSSRLYLRDVRATDVNETYVRWLNDPEVVRFLETRLEPQTRERVAAYVHRVRADPAQLLCAIVLRVDDRHIGNIKLGPVQWYHRRAELSLFIGDRAAWGQGYATEAISALTNWALASLGLHRVEAGCYSENRASIRAFEKAGFALEASLRQRLWSGDRFDDHVWMARAERGT